MTDITPKQMLVHAFYTLPKPHRIGLGALCFALSVIALSNLKLPQHSAPPATDITNTLEDFGTTETDAPPMIDVTKIEETLASSLDVTPTTITDEVSTNAPIAKTPTPPATAKPQKNINDQTIKNGDTLADVFKRGGVDAKYMYHLIHNHPKGKTLARIFPGHTLRFIVDSNGVLTELHHIEDALHKEVFIRTDKGYDYSTVTKKPEIRLVRTEGVITHSLYSAAKKAKLEDRLTMSLANIFGWDVDFALDIREKDSFAVVYEEQYLDGKFLGTGDIIAAEFINQGKTYRSVRYTDTQGNTAYYTPSGDTMRKAFLRTPIEFARISSHFNMQRKHPILNTIRAHKGTDYAAPRGTPIRATGNGKVAFAGTKSGYGNTLILQHGQKYQTLYAHLSKFGKDIRQGKPVKQGQIVAYVGTTGLSTAPHLHYEFKVNGAVRNPVTVQLPNADPVPQAERARFLSQTRPLVAKLDAGKSSKTQIASQNGDSPNTTPM